MDHIICKHEYEINSFLINPQKKLGIYFLLNLLQDTAASHASHHGFGLNSDAMKSSLWVLTRQQLIQEEWPEWGDRVHIQSWIRPPRGHFVIRDFAIFNESRQIGSCSASFLLLNSQTRRPIKDDLSGLDQLARHENTLSLEIPKIEIASQTETLAQFQVRNSDLDMNQHVNNTKYVQWILDSVPFPWLSKFKVHEYQVNFLAETKSGDQITIQRTEAVPAQANQKWVQFQGWRESDQKHVFAARLRIEEKI